MFDILAKIIGLIILIIALFISPIELSQKSTKKSLSNYEKTSGGQTTHEDTLNNALIINAKKLSGVYKIFYFDPNSIIQDVKLKNFVSTSEQIIYNSFIRFIPCYKTSGLNCWRTFNIKSLPSPISNSFLEYDGLYYKYINGVYYAIAFEFNGPQHYHYHKVSNINIFNQILK